MGYNAVVYDVRNMKYCYVINVSSIEFGKKVNSNLKIFIIIFPVKSYPENVPGFFG